MGKSFKRHAIYGLSRYLFGQKKISQPLLTKSPPIDLPEIYADYLLNYQQKGSATDGNTRQNRRVLCAFHEYLQKEQIDLKRLDIKDVDTFLAQFFGNFTPSTQRAYRSKLRGFLTYLYQERRIIKRDLASFIVAKRQYGLSKPPKFLRPKEIQKLFAGFSLSSDSDIRTYAMMHLAYTLGLRPKEIALIKLDDIAFSKAELTIEDRKNSRPIVLPIPGAMLKAVAAYRIAVRHQTKQNALFLTLHPPYRPVNPNTVGQHIRKVMKAAGLPSTTYWLRHSCAVSMLSSGYSLSDIRNQLGHEDLQATMVYLKLDLTHRRKIQKKFIEFNRTVLIDHPEIEELINTENKDDIMAWLDSL